MNKLTERLQKRLEEEKAKNSFPKQEESNLGNESQNLTSKQDDIAPKVPEIDKISDFEEENEEENAQNNGENALENATQNEKKQVEIN